MLDDFGRWIANVRLVDLLDICIVAVLLYVVLGWLLKRTSRAVVLGLAGVAVIYALARWLQLYLTTMLFQTGFLALLLALVVVLQDDIRRAFERLAAIRWFQGDPQSRRGAAAVETITDSVSTFAEQCLGALIVFEGVEPLDRHTRGGTVVDGLISSTLLHSIFHPESPGHDGAVLVRGDRVRMLGVHLPLSANLGAVGDGGTRHAAALGLIERCDALAVVVSEERGTISLAADGKLRQIGAAELNRELTAYYQQRLAPAPRRPWHHMLLHNGRVKLAALALAAVIWFFFAFRIETLQRNYVVPIQYRNAPPSVVLDDSLPTYATLTLSGSERAFEVLDAASLIVSFDVRQARPRQAMVLHTADGVPQLPEEIALVSVQPERIRLQPESAEAAVGDR